MDRFFLYLSFSLSSSQFTYLILNELFLLIPSLLHHHFLNHLHSYFVRQFSRQEFGHLLGSLRDWRYSGCWELCVENLDHSEEEIKLIERIMNWADLGKSCEYFDNCVFLGLSEDLKNKFSQFLLSHWGEAVSILPLKELTMMVS